MSKLTKIEEFVKEHLVYVNRSAGEITYNYEGDNYEEGFHLNPLTAIRAAIRRIERWGKGKP